MTAYELASLHTQIADNMNAQLSNWLAILSLYLGAGYLLAHRLSRTAAITLSGIFLVVAGGWTTVLLRTFQSFIGVSREIRKLATQDTGLAWHQAVQTPDSMLAAFPITSTILLWVIILGALYFFFASRRQNLKAPSTAA